MSRFLPKLARDKGSLDAAKATLLAANELFQNLDADAMAEVSAMTDVSTCPADQVLFGPENTGEVLFFLKKGTSNSTSSTPKARNWSSTN